MVLPQSLNLGKEEQINQMFLSLEEIWENKLEWPNKAVNVIIIIKETNYSAKMSGTITLGRYVQDFV